LSKVLIIGSSLFYEELFSSIADVETNEDVLVSDPEKINLVLFTGGADVHPIFYNGVHNGTSMVSYNRDVYEQAVFEWCQEHGIKTTGICRGFQFLNVMCGGFMYQHITGHGIAGLHSSVFPKLGDFDVRISSTHHQLVGLNEDAISMAWSNPNRSDIYIGPKANVVEAPVHEIEAAIFPKHNAMGVQFHPEMMSDASQGRKLYLQMVVDFLELNMDDFINKYGVTEQWQNQKMELRN
jgi:gamma-glutamyl-gamma-aminobutyrate hydrolase PuuD